MRHTGIVRWAMSLWPVLVVAGCAMAAVLPATLDSPPPARHELSIVAMQYGYEPHRFVVNTGDTVVLRLASRDVVHGFFLEGHDLEAEVHPGELSFRARRPSENGALAPVEELSFTAGRPGKYRYRCSVTCGTLHPFMQGEMIVRPNLPFRAGVAGSFAVALVAGGGLLGGRGRWRRDDGAPANASRRVDLFAAVPGLRWLLERRWFQFAVVVPNLIILFFFIVAGFLGSPIGNRNIIVTVVWILWWFLLITLLVPAGGRVWCMVCPLPFVGEWFARRRLVGVRPAAERSRSLRTGSRNRRWPKRLSGLWLQGLLFLLMCSFSTILVTRPALTAVVLTVMLAAAVVVHALYRRRSFCRHLCPLNAWMSVYSMSAMTELRVADSALCAACTEHACTRGSANGWGCPWLVNPSKLERNNFCGLCMECVKACPNRNLTLKVRPFCSDVKLHDTAEAWMALMMVALVVAYTVTLLGPWRTVKMWANVSEVGNWAGFAVHTAAVWLGALVVLPGLWYAGAWLASRLAGSREVSPQTIFVRYAYLLVPLGLLAWMAFSIPLVMVNYTHITASLSDPLGWGWDLFGTARQVWQPLLPELVPYLQIPLLLLGLAVSLARGRQVAAALYRRPAAAARSLLPHGALCTVITLVLLRLFVG